MNLCRNNRKNTSKAPKNKVNITAMGKHAAIIFGLHFMSGCVSETSTDTMGKSDTAPTMEMGQTMQPDQEMERTFNSISITFGGVPGIYSVDGTAALVKFMDFADQKSVDFFNGAETQLRATYAALGDMERAGKLVIYYRAYPLEANLSKNAIPAIRAALCAKDQGKFWEMHDKLLIDRSWMGVMQPGSTFAQIASKVGIIDTTKFSSCYSQGTIENARIMSEDIAEASINEVHASPTTYLMIPKNKMSRNMVYETYIKIDQEGDITLFESDSHYVVSYVGVYPINLYGIFLDKL